MYCIRCNIDGVVTKSYSTTTPTPGDILVPFLLDAVKDSNDQYIYTWDGDSLSVRAEGKRELLYEAKQRKIEKINLRARNSFENKYDYLAVVKALCDGGTAAATLKTDITKWIAARETAIAMVNAATTRAEIANADFVKPT
jgi:hypothetical protein